MAHGKKKNIIRRAILSNPEMDLLRICSYSTLIFKYRAHDGLTGWEENNGGNAGNRMEKGSGDGDTSRPETIVYATDCQLASKKVLAYLKSVPFGAEKLYLLYVREREPVVPIGSRVVAHGIGQVVIVAQLQAQACRAKGQVAQAGRSRDSKRGVIQKVQQLGFHDPVKNVALERCVFP